MRKTIEAPQQDLNNFEIGYLVLVNYLGEKHNTVAFHYVCSIQKLRTVLATLDIHLCCLKQSRHL